MERPLFEEGSFRASGRRRNYQSKLLESGFPVPERTDITQLLNLLEGLAELNSQTEAFDHKKSQHRMSFYRGSKSLR